MFPFLLSAALVLPMQTGQPAAMVLTTKGTVTFERAKDSSRRLGALALVWPADRVQVPPGGQVTLVFLADGHRERLTAPATVEAKGCGPAAAVERLEDPALPPENLDGLRDLAASSRGAVGVLRGDPPPTAYGVTPLYGATILTERPTLTWCETKANAYLVQVFSDGDGGNKRLVWKATVKEPRIAHPVKEPLKLGVLYYWTVIPLKGADASAESIVASKFHVRLSAEIAIMDNLKPLLASNAPADLLLAAACYEAHGVYDEALRLYERLAKLSPHEANFQVALASYYDRAGRPDLAEMARQRAKKQDGDPHK